MAKPAFIEENTTYRILKLANEGRYAVGAYNCYNVDGVMAVLRAAERKRSPAIIQLFPWTLHFQGPHFVRYVVSAAHAASVPVAVHLDHCIKPADIDLALTLPFDSIMIDASTSDHDQNLAICVRDVARAHEKHISVEVEMGRIEGGEDGLSNVDLGSVLTQPDEAKDFMAACNAQFLAPSFGNIHGGYGPGGAEKSWNMDLLKRIKSALPPEVPLVLHGTHPVSDELFQRAIKCGVSKINVNRTVRDDYTAFMAENAGKMELTALSTTAVEVYAKSCERIMDVFGSTGKA